MTASIENIDQDTGEITELKLIESSDLLSIFTNNDLDSIIDQLESRVLSVVTDPSTTKGRKEISSLARKVSSSKVALDDAGKSLVAEWKGKSKLVDASRKAMRDRLDNLRDKINKPVTEWKAEQARRDEQDKIRLEWIAAFDEALSMNDLFNREKIIAEKERIEEEKEAEELRLKEKDRIAAETLERERLLKEQAAEQARLQAEQEAQAKIDKAKRLEAEAKANEERAKREAIEAESKAKRDAEQAETDRLQAIEDARVAQENAVHEAQEQAKLEAERVEQERIDVELEEQRKAQLLAVDLNHRTNLNREALICFVDNKIDVAMGKKIISLIAKGKIKNISINY